MSLFGRTDKRSDRTGDGAAPAAAASVRESTEPSSSSTDSGRHGSRGRSEGSGFGRRADRGDGPQSGGGDVASIGKSVVFKGDLSGDEDLEIEGRIEGQIQLPNHQLTIGAHGRVKAQIEAKTVVVVGHVSGNVTATERCEVQASGVVDGDIRAPRLLIQEGAVVNGNIEMGEKAKAATAGAHPPTPEPARKAG